MEGKCYLVDGTESGFLSQSVAARRSSWTAEELYGDDLIEYGGEGEYVNVDADKRLIVDDRKQATRLAEQLAQDFGTPSLYQGDEYLIRFAVFVKIGDEVDLGWIGAFERLESGEN